MSELQLRAEISQLRSELQLRAEISQLRSELETRYKFGTVKIAAADGTPVPAEQLQNRMFKLIYKLSKLLTAIEDEVDAKNYL